MEDFFSDLTAALSSAHFSEDEAHNSARLAISRIESPLIRPKTFATSLEALSGRYCVALERAIGGPIERLIIAPIPSYIVAALPDILAEFPWVIFADNFKAGTEIAGQLCVTLDEALADRRPSDTYLLATVDQRLGRLFRDRLPPDRTIGAAELVWLDPQSPVRPVSLALERFNSGIKGSTRPLLVVTAYLDATFGPTLEALNSNGFDVFIITRHAHSTADPANVADPKMIGADRHYVAEFDEMLWLLRQTDGCPVLLNYVRFFASHWDLQDTVSLFAYCIALMKVITGPRLLHLYDAFQVSINGLEAERASFSLYRDLLDAADGILVNADVEAVLREYLGQEKPIISFLRYGPDVGVGREPDEGPFSIVMITGFLGEGNDPTRMTAGLVHGLLHEGFHVHYYSSSPVARGFRETLSADDAARFHLHDPIRDQRALVREISRYHAGWFVADMACCERLSDVFETPFAKSLANCFVPTTVATAGILYGCAGLPTIFNAGHYTARLFPPGTAIEFDLRDVAALKGLIEARDWKAMRETVSDSRQVFSTRPHVRRLAAWLEQFYSLAGEY